MKRNIIIFLVFALALSSAAISFSRSQRIAQIPNGKKFRCLNCHPTSSDKKILNGFGSIIGEKYLSTGPKITAKVLWGSELAALDSDGDGYTNGIELDDPKGELLSGDSTNFDRVFNPGAAESHPIDSPADDQTPSFLKPAIAELKVFGNTGVNPSLYIKTESATFCSIEIYGSTGEFIVEGFSGLIGKGERVLSYNELGLNGRNLASGVYVCVVRSAGEKQTVVFTIAR